MNRSYESNASSTSAPTAKQRAKELLTIAQQGLPVWVRAPKRGPERYTGLTRPKLYALAAAGKIRSTSLREPGMKFGTRLFHLPSILAFIETHAASGSHLNDLECYRVGSPKAATGRGAGA